MDNVNGKNPIWRLNLLRWLVNAPQLVAQAGSSTQKRLAKAFAFVESLERQRAEGQNPFLGKIVEDRMIWRELLELELQDIDEQMEQISAGAAKERGLAELKEKGHG
jgi:hypothetical protein